MQKFLKSNYFIYFFLYLIICLGSGVRLWGLNWDQNQHLHPDERFMTMVTQAVSWPSSFNHYLDSSISTLNPRNVGFDFFVYGTLPIKITKWASDSIVLDTFDYNNITLVGRFLSALFDIGVLILIFLIAKKIFDIRTGLIASSVYALTVLPIQLAHFYAVDTLLTFFITLCFYLLILLIDPNAGSKNHRFLFIPPVLGTAFGFALASKISALLFLPTIGLGFLFVAINQFKRKIGSVISVFFSFFIFLCFGYLSFRLANPENFQAPDLFNPQLSERFVANLKTLNSFNDPESYFPPGIQWISTKPITFAFGNNILWGLGLPLGILGLVSIFMVMITLVRNLKSHQLFKESNLYFILILFWIFSLFCYQSLQFSKNLRYFYPIYPLIIICVSLTISRIKSLVIQPLLFILLLIWPLFFLSIYSHPHSRISASDWIYENIPNGSTLSCEHWDDCLPLSLKGRSLYEYRVETLELFHPDTFEKWQKINSQLETIDYLILSSNRLWGSIPKVPEKYPITSKFYSDLFEEKLEFKKVAEFTSFPKLKVGNWKLEIPDEVAEESFTVYDHPKVIIFQRTKTKDTHEQDFLFQ